MSLSLADRIPPASVGGGPERTVCDYVAGMTDRYARDEFLGLFQPYPDG